MVPIAGTPCCAPWGTRPSSCFDSVRGGSLPLGRFAVGAAMDELNNTFFRMNRGLQSRFIWRFSLSSYTGAEMMEIFKHMVLTQDWFFLDEDTVTSKWFESKKDTFLYFGRDMELLFTYTKIAHGCRIYGLDVSLKKKINTVDMDEGYKTFLKNRKIDKEPSFMHSIYV